jgi:hypothetical protein
VKKETLNIKAKHMKHFKILKHVTKNSIYKVPSSSELQERGVYCRNCDGEGAGSSGSSKCYVTTRVGED